MNPSPLVLGIDGGGTRTRAALVEADGTVRGLGEVAGCNYHNIGAATAVTRIGEAARQAFVRAGRPVAAPAAIFLGAAGIKSAADADHLRSALAADDLFPAGRLTIGNDAENAHAAALVGGPGVILICGTGSIALARGTDGCSHFCGGWGWLLDDAGSACWIGLRALQAVARAVDGRGSDTRLRETFISSFGITDPHDLLQQVYVNRYGPAEFGALAPAVMAAARAGDAVANDILQTAANEAARLVTTAAATAQFGPSFAVALVGGAARSGAPYQPMLEDAIRRAAPGARLVVPALPPVLGAALRALALAGIPPTPAIVRQMQRTSPALSPDA